MCGIAGGTHGIPAAPVLSGILDRLRHRGPDDNGTFVQGPVWLCNTRLAIQDKSGLGHQPMRTPDGRHTLVYNGELYNQWELRRELESMHGVRFRSACDTEVLLHAFAAWGADCLDRLEGDFAFAIYDDRKQELFLARDRLGVKPLYYYDDGTRFLFASELAALTAIPGIDYSLAPEVFQQYLLFLYSPSHATPFRHIKKLLPGHFIRVPASYTASPLAVRYYSIPLNGAREDRSIPEWTRHLDTTLSAAVASRVQLSDVPVGLTLSGGLDSSLIAAMARRLPHADLQAFCIGTGGAMKSEGFADDLPFARMVARQQGILLHEVPGRMDIGAELDTMIRHLGEPQADPAALHMAHIAAAARECGVRVLLSGTGADDQFSGYRRHMAIPALKLLSLMPGQTPVITERLAAFFPGSAIMRRASKLAGSAGLSLEKALIHTHFWAVPDRICRLFQAGILSEEHGRSAYTPFLELLTEIPGERHPLNHMLLYELRAFLPHHNLAYMDKMAMAHSVELRVPFTDAQVVALSAALPPELKLHRRSTKFILRKLASSYLPDAVIRRAKTGFGAPLRAWAKGEGRAMIRERLSDHSFIRHGIFRQERIQSLIREHEAGRTDAAYTLFSLLSIESWLRQFAPNP